MPKFLATLISNPAVRKAFYALVLAVAAALGYTQFGCGMQVPPNVATQLEVFSCQLDAIQSVVPHVAIAEEVVIAARAGNIPYVVGLLTNMGATKERIEQAADAYDACLGEEPAPVVLDSTTQM